MKFLSILFVTLFVEGCSILPPLSGFDDQVTLIKEKPVEGTDGGTVTLTFTNSWFNHSMLEIEKNNDFPEEFVCSFDIESKDHKITQAFTGSRCNMPYSFYRVERGTYIWPRNVQCKAVPDCVNIQ